MFGLIIKELEIFTTFLKKYDKIYLYGAGKIGRRYARFLSMMGIVPAGFIITEGNSATVDGIEVFPVSDLKNEMSCSVGVIIAFRGADEQDIRLRIGALPGLLKPKDDFQNILELETIIFPFFRDISKPRQNLKPVHEWSRILIVRLDVLGDLIMSTALIREIRKNCPDSHITLVVRSSNEMLFRECPYIDDLIVYDCDLSKTEADISLEELESLWKKVKKFITDKLSMHYDIVFQLCSLLNGRGALEAVMLGYASEADCQIGRVYAWKKSVEKSNYIYKRFSDSLSCVTYDAMPKHEVACMLDMLRKCGGRVENERLELWFADRETNMLPVSLSSNKRWLAIGVVGRIPSQCWPADRFQDFFLQIGERYRDVGFILFGGNDAVDTAGKIVRGMQSSVDVMDLTGKTSLAQAAYMMKKCIAYVGANTGLMHMAAALGLPVVEISFYVRGEDGKENSPMGPWGTKSIVLQKFPMDDCREICCKPYSHCITQITVEEVSEAVEKMLCVK